MELQEKFADAQARSKKLPQQGNNTLLDLYSLYKQSTEGDVSGSRPGMMDFKGVAKYNAWESKKGKTKEQAMQEYIDLVNKLEG